MSSFHPRRLFLLQGEKWFRCPTQSGSALCFRFPLHVHQMSFTFPCPKCLIGLGLPFSVRPIPRRDDILLGIRCRECNHEWEVPRTLPIPLDPETTIH